MATTKVCVNVTANDIRRGYRGDNRLCPIARAMARTAVARHRYVSITGEYAAVREEIGNGYELSGDLPPEARDFVARFDAGDPVQPIRFCIDLAD